MPLRKVRGFHGNHEGYLTTYDHVNSYGSQSVRAMQCYYNNLPAQQIVIGCRVRTGVSRLSMLAEWNPACSSRDESNAWSTRVGAGLRSVCLHLFVSTWLPNSLRTGGDFCHQGQGTEIAPKV
jgi:hypothetical protein